MKSNIKKSLEEARTLISMLEIQLAYLEHTLEHDSDLADELQLFMASEFELIKQRLDYLRYIEENLRHDLKLLGETGAEKEYEVDLVEEIIGGEPCRN